MNNIKQSIKNNKKIILISIILIIIFNLLSNTNSIISMFNKTKPITYKSKEMIIENDNYIIENINKKTNIIEITFNNNPNNIEISYTSDKFKNYKHYNINYSKNNIKTKSIYIISSTNDTIKNLRISASKNTINSITINPKIKYNFNIIKNISTFILIISINYILKNKRKLNFNNQRQKFTIIIILISLICIAINYYYSYKTIYTFGDIYEKSYVDAIMNKTLELDLPISTGLKNDPNPYDTSNRDYQFFWDTSYYKGKYYCYFGIWPIISLFIPYKIITNSYLTTPLATLLYTIIAIIGTSLLFKEIIKKYFKNIHLETYIISLTYIIIGSKLFWCMYRPSFYELTTIAAYTHIIFGLYLTLFNDNKIKNLIGYTLLALAVLCRPTTLFASILIIPKIINNIKTKNFKLKDFIILCIPYVIVGSFTMYINYIRFDSIFEFGTSYQLTTNNLNNYNFSFINIIYGMYHYLLGKINITLSPLTIIDPPAQLHILGDLNIEKIGGGLITTSILSIIILFIPKIFKFIKEKELKIYIILSILLSLFIMGFSSSIGAIVGRYMLDFNYLIYFVTVILCLYTINHYNNKYILKIYYILTTLSIILNLILSSTIDI